MNKKISIIIILALLSYTSCFSQALSGSKTIGGTVPDYNTFTDAITALNSNGVNGAVIFNVRSGTYSEQLTLTEITGASSSNTITFQSESGDSTDVIIDYAPSSAPSNYTMNMNGVDYVIFKNLTLSSSGSAYARVVAIYSAASNNEFHNCQFIGITASSDNEAFSLIHSYGNQDDNNTFESNYFKNGSYGIYYVGADPGDETGTIIRKNYFSNQYTSAIFIRFQDAPVIDSNYIETNTSKTDIQCIYAWECDNEMSIQKNTISLPSSSGGYGIYLYNSDGIVSAKGLVANNFIKLNSSGNFSCGIYMRFCDYQQFYHNTINLSGELASASCIFFGTGNAYTSISNNILYNEATGYALYISETAAISSSDYNDLITTGTNLCYYNGNITDLSDWQSSTPYGENSVSVDPYFFSEQDLHANNTSLQSGTTLTEVTTDIDGESRDGSTPCMGADEFIYPALGGIYTIGSGGSDYTSITEAVQALTDGGVRDAVYFNIENGTYTEQIVIPDVNNTSPANRITFQSASGDSSMVVLTYSPSGSGANYTAQLNDAHFIDFNEMTISSGGTDYSGVIEILGGSSDLRFQNTQIIGGESAVGLTNGILIKGDVVAVENNIEFIDNLMQYGTYGIKIAGDNSTKTSVNGNHFLDQSYWSVNLITIKAPVVSGNYFDYSKSSVFYGIYFHICDSALKLSNNYFVAPNSSEGFGLWHRLCDGDAADYGLISNNYMQINCSGTYAYGIYYDESTYQKFYHNSINISGNLQSTRALSIVSDCSDISLRNNLISNEANGYSCYSEVTTNISSDYNNLYTSGINIGYWDGANRTDLPAWQTATGQDANSFSIAPQFPADNDPHFPNSLLNDAGTAVAEVTEDIDGEMRDPANPDIGADEFCTPPIADDKFGCTTRIIPDLTAVGNNIKWYSDGTLTTVVHSGSNFPTGHTNAGTYTYYATQTINESESQADTVVLTINTTPGIPPASDETICFGEATPDLTATGTDLKWYDDKSLTSLVGSGSPFGTGQTIDSVYTYYVTQTTLDGCESDPDTSVLTIHPIPSAPDNGLFISCFGDNVPDLTAVGENVQWYSDEALTDSIYAGNTYSSGDTLAANYAYFPTQTVNGCESAPAYDTLRIKPRPDIPLTDDQSICIGDNVPDLTASGNSIRWYGDSSRSTLLHTGDAFSTGETAVGTYPYYATQTVDGCESLNELVTLAINEMPVVSVLTDTIICEVDTLAFQLGIPALSAHSYLWTSSQGDLTSSEANPSVKPVVPGTYKYYLTEIIDSSGCQDSDTVSITIYPDPVSSIITAASDTTFCLGNSVLLSVTDEPYITYSWKRNGGMIGSDQNTYLATESGEYAVSLENGFGCTKDAYNSILVTVNDTPSISTISVVGNLTFCDGKSVSFSAPYIDGLSYQWQRNGADIAGANANVYIAQVSGIFRLITTTQFNCSTSTQTQEVTVLEKPEDQVITAHSATSFCHGDSVRLSVPEIAGLSYEWRLSGGSTTGNFTHEIVIRQTGGYYMEVTNSENCTALSADTIQVNSYPVPENVILSREGPDVFCEGDSCRLFVADDPLYSYIWKKDGGIIAGASSHDLIIKEQGSYSVLVGNTLECSVETGDQIITVNLAPTADVLGDKVLCLSQTGTYGIGPATVAGHSYSWISEPEGFTETIPNPIVSPTKSIIYILTETIDATGCTDTDSVIFTINPDPLAKVRDDTSACHSLAGEFDIGADPVLGSSYSWTSSHNDLVSSISNPSVHPVTPGTYHYFLSEKIDLTNCAKTDTVTIVIHPDPLIILSALENPFTKGDSTTLIASGANEYQWSPATGLASTTGAQVKASPSAITTYYLEATSQFGCKEYDSIDLYVYCPACDTVRLYTEASGNFNIGCTNNLYKNNLDCSWTLLPSGVGYIYLYFPPDEFDVKTGDWIWVYDGQDITADTIGRYNNDKPPQGQIKGGSALHIRFTTDGSETGLGFEAEWSNDPSLEVSPQSAEQFRIYPNPANDILYIEWNSTSTEDVYVRIYNNLGQLVLNRKVPPQPGPVREEFNLQNWQAGIYFVHLNTADKVVTRKIVRE
ncbi:T9SS type A sorting domain-containing protein [Bacteroidota bacterium]